MPWRRQSYEVLPALSVRGRQLRHYLRVVTGAWMLGVVWMVCVSGAQMKNFAEMLGFEDIHFGILGALPFIATFGQVVASVLIEQTGLRKFQFLHCGTVHRLLWVALAAVPLALSIPSGGAVLATLAILAISWFAASLSTPAWLTWMGDLIPRRIRGRYFAARIRWTEPIRIVVVIAVGVLLDAATVEGAPMTAAAQPRLLYVICGLFVVGALFGAGDILAFRSLRDVMPSRDNLPPVFRVDVPRPTRPSPLRLAGYGLRAGGSLVRQTLVEPLGDAVFRHYVLYGMTITFVTSVGMWFFWRNAMDNLGFSMLAANVLFLIVSPVSGIVAAQVWGRLIDRWGRRPILIIATMGTVLSIIPWFLIARHTPHPAFVESAANWLAGLVGPLVGRSDWVWVTADTPAGAYLGAVCAAALGGWFWTGVGLAQTGIMLGFSDGQGRSKFVAASAVLMSLGGVVGGIVGGSVAQSLQFLQAEPIVVGPFLWNNWHATFLLSGVFRIAAIGWLIGMPDPGAGRVRDMLRTMRGNVYNAVAPRLFYPIRVFGWGRRRPGRDRSQDS